MHASIGIRTVLALTLVATPLAAAVAAPKAAFVESVLPSRPFNASANGSAGYVSIGPGADGVLGVGSITLTNFSGIARTIFVFAPVFTDGQACGSTSVIGGAGPRFYVTVPGNQTVHLVYPTPMVYTRVGGQSCVAFSGATNVDITVNGLVN